MSKDKPESTQALAAAPVAPKAPDPHQGRGGMYTVVNGVRQRVDGTKAAHEQAKKG